MRLYGKLIAMMLLFAGAQRSIADHGPDWVFAARCQLAIRSSDTATQEKLIDEACHQLYIEQNERFERLAAAQGCRR